MSARTGIPFHEDRADLARLILDAIEIAVRQARWEVADRLLSALEALEEGKRGRGSLDSAYRSVARMICARSDVRHDL